MFSLLSCLDMNLAAIRQLVYTFPITKKNKYTVVTEAHKKVLVLLMSQQICSRRPIQAPSGVFPPSKSAGLSARSCVTSQAHEAFLRAIYCPSRASSQCYSQAPGASRTQHRLSSFLLTKSGSHGCNAVGCANTNGHRPTNTRSSFSAPEAVLNEVEQRFDTNHVNGYRY